ncbi:MAG: hypothetical protein L6Q97_09810 [Thermoanaerobaculia bacterium]|nr:hypothetical protein [Thermoanaerobaculia bacterium]
MAMTFGNPTFFKILKEIGEILSDSLIRRVKKEVLRDLPKRMDKVLFVPMTREQKDIHRELADAVARLVAKWRRFHFLNETDRRMLILCLSQMRMVADSTFILDIPWNPAILEQRVGGIHRMGQTENVTVVNMVSAESIEQRMLGVLEFKSSMAQGVLDPDGDDTIFMSESKFKKFMENVETLTGEGWQARPADVTDTASDDAGSEDFEQPPSPLAPEPDVFHPRADTFPGDDDTPDEAPSTASPQTSATRETQQASPGEGRDRSAATAGGRPQPAAAAPTTPRELVQTGVSFFSGLAQTLSSPEKTRELVQSIVATDAETGQTYLKIPVESAAAVENAVRLLGGLLAGLGRG